VKFVKVMMIVAVAAGVLSLGACAQKKEEMAPAPAPTGYTKYFRPAVRLRPDNFNPRGQVVTAAWPFTFTQTQRAATSCRGVALRWHLFAVPSARSTCALTGCQPRLLGTLIRMKVSPDNGQVVQSAAPISEMTAKEKRWEFIAFARSAPRYTSTRKARERRAPWMPFSRPPEGRGYSPSPSE
jgi:hypothetical protein